MKKRIISFLIFLLLLSGCNSTAEFKSQRRIENVHDLDGRKIGVNLGWAPDFLLTPNEDIQLFRYESTADMLIALFYKQLDAIAIESTDWKLMNDMTTGLRAFPEKMIPDAIMAACREDSKYKDEFNEFVDEFNKTPRGIERLEDLASFDDYNFKDVELTGTGETIKVNISGTDNYPFCFMNSDGKMSGFDIEIFSEYANAYNYQIEFVMSSWNDAFINVMNKKADFASGYISYIYGDEYASMGVALTGVLGILDVLLIEVEDYDNVGIDADKIADYFP